MFYMALFLLLCRFAYLCIEWLGKHTALIPSSAHSRPSHDRFHKQLSLLVERFINCVGSMSRRERFGLYWTPLHRVRELVLDILKGKLEIVLKGSANFILDRYFNLRPWLCCHVFSDSRWYSFFFHINVACDPPLDPAYQLWISKKKGIFLLCTSSLKL